MTKRAYLGIKYHADHRNRSKIATISAALEQRSYTVTCITRDIEHWGAIAFTPQELMERTFEIISESDIVVIDLSEKGVGLGIEAGYACAQGVPIITIADNHDISSTLQGISVHHYTYTGRCDLARFLKSILPLTDKEE